MKLSPTKKLTLAAMVVALSVLSLYVSAVIPNIKLACLFLSSLFIFVLAEQEAYVSAITAYIAASVISFLLLPDKLLWGLYVALCGHYGIFKTYICTKLGDKVISFLLRLVYANVFIGIGLAAAVYIAGFDPSSVDLPIQVWLAVILLELALVAFDLLYSFMQRIYIARFRDALIPRR